MVLQRPTTQQVDDTNCAREPIHLAQAIQPHGHLLVVRPSDQVVLRCDVAARELFGADPIGTRLDDLFDTPVGPLLARRQPRAHGPPVSSGIVEAAGTRCTLIAHELDDQLIVELERGTAEADPGWWALVDHAVASLTACTDEPTLYRTAVRELQRMTGHHRVMFYVFDPDQHGHVVAEESADGEPRFLGLHFPESDIPRQARRLYTLTPSRGIADASADGVPLSPRAERPLDMTWCQTRAVSPIHLEYLRNMEVAASFSASVVVAGELRGLVACHHDQVLHLPYAKRLGVGVVARTIAQQLASLSARRAHAEQGVREGVELLFLRHFVTADTPLAAMRQALPDAVRLVNSDGFVVKTSAGLLRHGPLQPPEAFVDALAAVAEPGTVWASEHLAHDAPEAHAAAEGGVAGALVVPLQRGGCIAWLRLEELQHVQWAGEPDKRIDATTGTLRPRASFAKWEQLVRDRCVAWSRTDRDVATVLQRAMGHRLGHPDHSFETILDRMQRYVQQLKVTNVQLRRSNADLEQFAYAAAHDLQSPLRTIKGFVDMIDHERRTGTATLPPELEQYWAPIGRGLHTMRELLTGLLDYSRLGSAQLDDTPVPLGDVLHNVRRSLSADLSDDDATVVVEELPSVEGSRVQLQRLFQNLLDNALKYHRPDVPPQVHVTAERHGDRFAIDVRDNGQGIPQDLQAKAFELFRRLHRDDARGSGLGLAMAKRIAERHGGSIEVESEVGVGSCFRVWLPALEEE
ncbi:MAG: GAF domain-containing protein [Myxococcales bacterium]|nr:GAF domain-containing protein [Myxococcales bacterium]